MNFPRRIFIQKLITVGAVLNSPHVGMAATVGKKPLFGVILGLLKQGLEMPMILNLQQSS
jgi:hypothetical protein